MKTISLVNYNDIYQKNIMSLFSLVFTNGNTEEIIAGNQGIKKNKKNNMSVL